MKASTVAVVLNGLRLLHSNLAAILPKSSISMWNFRGKINES